MVDGQRVGWVADDFAARLLAFPSLFTLSQQALKIHSSVVSSDTRCRAFAEVLGELRCQGLVPGWRDELYPVVADYHSQPLFAIERAAAYLFGLRTFGVHLLGYIGAGLDMRLWVARRSESKQTGPGQKDALVGGGLAYGQAPFETMIREAWEEAGLNRSVVENAHGVGEVRFIHQDENGIDQGLDYQFEIQLDEEITPQNQDGEVAGFELLPVGQVMDEIAEGTGYFYDANLAFIAFFVRHGLVSADDPDLPALKAALKGKIA